MTDATGTPALRSPLVAPRADRRPPTVPDKADYRLHRVCGREIRSEPFLTADLAGLKVAEHVDRYTRHIGDPGEPALHLLTVAESLVDLLAQVNSPGR